MSEQPKKKGLPTWVIVLIVVAASVPVVIGIFSAVAIYGVRKYLLNAKRAEATSALATWSKGMVACGEADGLPLTSPAVPASIAAISAKKYQSVASEWSDPAFVCAGFSMTGPQYFQYQWLQEAPTGGKLVALADLDGDGNAEQRVQVTITCAKNRCAATLPHNSEVP